MNMKMKVISLEKRKIYQSNRGKGYRKLCLIFVFQYIAKPKIGKG